MDIRTRFKVGETVFIKDAEERGKVESIYINVSKDDTATEYTVRGVDSGIKYDVEESELGY